MEKETVFKKKYSGGDFCCVPNCFNQRCKDYKSGAKRTYYGWPKDLQRRKIWLKNIRRGGGWQPRSWDKVCSDHFVEGKKTDSPGSEGFVPTLFAFNKINKPRQTRCSAAAGYAPLPKTWFHVRHRLQQANRHSRQVAHDQSISHGRPADPPVRSALVPIFLQACGHDYLRTTMEKVPCSDELLNAMVENEKMSSELLTLRSRVLSLENLKSNDKLFQFYTNLPNFLVFDALRDYLEKRVLKGQSKLTRWKGQKGSFSQKQSAEAGCFKRGPDSKLSFADQMFLVLVKLKTGRMNPDLSYQFGLSPGLISETFTSWLFFLASELKLMFEVADCGEAVDGVPTVYRGLSNLRMIIDCTELMLQKPSDLQERKETFSNYKHHDTIKFLVGMSLQLYVNYISTAWAGRASDKHITLSSESLLGALPPGSKVMADRGFTVTQELKKLGVQTIIPTFKGRGRSQLSPTECQSSEDIAKARIHIERIIQRIRTFHILGSVIRLNMLDIVEQLFTVCAYLTNFQTPIIQNGDMKFA